MPPNKSDVWKCFEKFEWKFDNGAETKTRIKCK